MITDKRKFKVKITASNLNRYKEKYNCKLHDIIEVYVNELSKSSEELIECKCDVCGKELKKKYKDYNRSIKNGGYFSCSRKCSNKKREESNFKKYGVKFLSQSNEIKDKIKDSCIKHYGVDNPSKSKEIKIKVKKTKLERYNDENYNNLDKIKQTNLEKYGVEFSLSSPKIREKIKRTNFEKYGCFYINTDEFRKKSKKTKSEKYKDENYVNPKKSKKTKLDKYGNCNNFEKIKKTNIEKYGVDNVLKNEYVFNKSLNTRKENRIKNLNYLNLIDINDNIYTFKCDNGKEHSFDIEYDNFKNRKKYNTVICTICNPINSYHESGKEIKFKKIFEETNYIANSKKIIPPYELDIYLPDLNLAFEFNGIYWHNELNKPKNYHKIKSDLCAEKGIKLYHIWENDWDNKEGIIKSIVMKSLNKFDKEILIEKCNIKELNNINKIKKFTNDNHIHGFINSSLKLGLFYNNELVSLMLLKNNKENYEIVRFCDKLFHKIINSKKIFLDYLIKNYKVNDIKVSIDRSYFSEYDYIKYGFEIIKKTDPNYFTINKNIRIYDSGNIILNYGKII